MEPWLEALIAKGKQTGTLTYDEVNAAFPPELMMAVEQLVAVTERLDAEGITVIDGDEPEEQTALHSEPILSDQLPEAEYDPVYRRDATFEQRLRMLGVPFSDVMVSHESNGRVFDAELIVPGEQTLSAWLALRNALPATGLWPVIGREQNEPNFPHEPNQLDPLGRAAEWWRQTLRDPTIPLQRLTPEMTRADAAANIAEAEKVPPTPWTFRSAQWHGWTPPVLTEPDGPLPASEPNFAELFSNDGPFRCVRVAFGGNDWSFFPFLRLSLYPTAVPWEVFAYSPFGGWNECPWPDEQLAMLRHWHAACGAEVVSVRDDWYDLFIPRPPRTRHQAIALLYTHFGEDPSFHVPEGADALEALSRSHHWHFWWD